jgi:hypothetical protein
MGPTQSDRKLDADEDVLESVAATPGFLLQHNENNRFVKTWMATDEISWRTLFGLFKKWTRRSFRGRTPDGKVRYVVFS